jgi:hypothetical protein
VDLVGAMLVACTAFGFLFAGTAGAESPVDLSTKVLTQIPILGLIPTTPGPTNGPIDSSNIGYFGGKGGIVEQELASGDLVGYIRAFTHNPPNGQAVVIEGDWVKDQSNIPEVLAGVEGAAKGPRFSVPGIADAIGFETTSPTSTAIQYAVACSSGNYVFIALAESTDGSLGKNSAVAVAAAQAAAVPGAPAAAASGTGTSNTYYKAGEVLGGVFLVVAILGGVTVAIRKSSNGTQTATPAPSASRTWPSPGASTTLQVGWHQVGQNFNEQFYWDGRGWAASRQWRAGLGWTESSITQPTSR